MEKTTPITRVGQNTRIVEPQRGIEPLTLALQKQRSTG